MDKLIINQLPAAELRGQRVFIRIDAGEQLSAARDLVDMNSLHAAQPTLEYLVSLGVRLIIGTHWGEPNGKVVESLRLGPVAERLSQLLGRPVRKLDSAIGREVLRVVSDLQQGEVVLLENLGFYPGEDTNAAEFARQLGGLAEVYCNDAFAMSHRGTASTVGITRHIRPAAAGLALARELMMLEMVLHKPEPPLVGIIGGARLEEKLPILENLLTRLDRLVLGGALSFAFMKAKGQEVGAAPIDHALLPVVKEFLNRAEKKLEVILPQDFTVVDAAEFQKYEEKGRTVLVPVARCVSNTEIGSSDLPVDIGPLTINRIKTLLDGGNTILWNGPLGIWEVEPFGAGTREIAKLFADRVSLRSQRSILCGDSLSKAIHSFDLPVERIRHLTSGGKAALQLLAGNPLPAVAALDDEVELIAPKKIRGHRILLPVDGSEHSLETAHRLSRMLYGENAEITLLYVQKLPGMSTKDTWIGPETKQQRELERKIEGKRIFSSVNAVLARYGLTSQLQVAVTGDPARQILKFAREGEVDLIAMGSRGLGGVRGVLMGSVSCKVLNHARCPVLIVPIPDAGMVKEGLL
ncbi:MAG: phosphoglycerate kinase, partial [Acidobacteria bacterium]|nr:phosphoglycerate kinase [Acidobacteriota bacterium]